MSDYIRERMLKVFLVIFGLIFIFGIYPLMMVWPSGWRWIPNQPEYEQMIMVIYVVLGIFLIFAAKNPQEHKSLIWFTIWSSIAHGGIMAYQAYTNPLERGHFIGDIPALFIVAIVLGLLSLNKRSLSKT